MADLNGFPTTAEGQEPDSEGAQAPSTDSPYQTQEQAPQSPQGGTAPSQQSAGQGRYLTGNALRATDALIDAGMTDPNQIASVLGVQNRESGMSPTAVNPRSGAIGLGQWLGDRKAAFNARFGEDDNAAADIGSQERFYLDELRGRAGVSDPQTAAAGKELSGIQNTDEGVRLLVSGDERPGPDTAGEIAGASQDAAAVLPLVQARLSERKARGPLGQNSGGPNLEAQMTVAQPSADEIARDQAIALWKKQNGPVGGGRFDGASLPTSEQSPSADPTADAITLWRQAAAKRSAALAPGAAPASSTPPAPSPSNAEIDPLGDYDWGSVWKAFKELPRGILQGIASRVGGVVDTANLGSHLNAEFPSAAIASAMTTAGGAGGVVMEPAAYGAPPPQGAQIIPHQPTTLPTAGSTTFAGMTLPTTVAGYAPGIDAVPIHDPNAQGSHWNLGTENIDKAVKYATGVDLAQQDQSAGGGVLYNAGLFTGYGFSPTNIAEDVKAGASAVRMAWQHAGELMGIGGGADLGAWAAGDTPREHAIADLLTIPAGIAARTAAIESVFGGAKGALGAGKTALNSLPREALDAAILKAAGGDHDAAGALKQQYLSAIDEFGRNQGALEALPKPGAVTPHPTLGAAMQQDQTVRDAYAALPEADQQAVNAEEASRTAPSLALGPAGGPSTFQPASAEQAGRLAQGGAIAQERNRLLAAGATPGGMNVPAALRAVPLSDSLAADPLREMFVANRLRGEAYDGHWLNSPNYAAMEGMRPEGDAADVVGAVRNMLTQGQALIDERLGQARDAADQAGRVAALNASLRRPAPGAPVPTLGPNGERLGLPEGGAEGATNAFNLAQETINQVREARADTFAMADRAWQVARDQGLTSTQASSEDTAAMYRSLEGQMQGWLQRGGNRADFPWDAVSPLYKSDPRGMFDAQRNRIPSTLGSTDDPGPNAFFKSPTLDQLKTVDSALGERIRQEQDALSNPGNRGNRLLLSNLQNARDAVWGAIDKIATQAGNIEALRNAMNMTALAHKTFSQGTVGHLLSTSADDAGLAGNPANLLRRYLGNSNAAIQTGRSLQQAIELRTGAAVARGNVPLGLSPGSPGLGSDLPGTAAIGASPREQMVNTMADWLRQDYLNTRADLGAKQAGNWLRNRAGMLSEWGKTEPTIGQLSDELNTYHALADHELPEVLEPQAARDQLAIQNSAAREFLGGEAGPNINAVLQSAAPKTAMRQLLSAATGQEDGGAALRGIQNMLFGRIMQAGKGIDARTGAEFFNPVKAQEFMADRKVSAALDVMREFDQGWAGRLQQLTNGLGYMRRSMGGAGMVLPEEAAEPVGKPGISDDLLNFAARIAGNRLIAPMIEGTGAGTIQAHALASSLGGKLLGRFRGKLEAVRGRAGVLTNAKRELAEALQSTDPTKLKGLLNTAPAEMQKRGALSGLAGEQWFWAAMRGMTHSFRQGLQDPLTPPGTPQSVLDANGQPGSEAWAGLMAQ